MPEADWSHRASTGLGTMITRPLTRSRFGDLARVFGDRGTPRRCFCMYWRRPDGGFADERDNRHRFRDRVEMGPPPGLVGYVEDRPVGWVQVGPRRDFPTLYRSRLLKPVDAVEPWAVTCFVVAVGHRRRGVATALLDAAIDYARLASAEVLEAYPVDGHRSGSGDYYTGTWSMFRARGFREVARRNDTRPIVRLVL
ncbi:MAG: GNAT family N-acetyltransferase [Actinomycetota bacterium]